MQNNFGLFLKQKRQEKNLTQKQLANLLFVSESAVSKWEKNVSRPDIMLLPELAELLGVTEHEIITASIDTKTRQEKKQAKKWRVFSLSWSLFFYISYGIALLTCFICNLAIDKTLSWFWIVLSALLLSFSFTNLPKIIKRNKLLFVPLSNFVSLCILLATCAIYTNGNWFWIATLSIFLGLLMIFAPIYISKYNLFAKIKKYNDFVSIGIVFIMLNVLLIVINLFSIANGYTNNFWYLSLALPIVAFVYFALNVLLCTRFLKTNKLIKTSSVLFFVNLFLFVPPLFVTVSNPNAQKEIDKMNILGADFSNWQSDANMQQNIFCIIFLTILILAIIFFVSGIIKHNKKRI